MPRHPLADVLAAEPGVIERRSQFGHPVAFWVHGREVAHFEGDDVLELRLTRPVVRAERAALRGDPRFTLRPSASDWVELRVAPGDQADAADALAWFRRAVAAHRPT